MKKIYTKADIEAFRNRQAKRRRACVKRLNKVAIVDATLPKDKWTSDTRVKLMVKDNAAEEHVKKLLNGMRVHFFRERPIEVAGKKYFIDFLVTSIKDPPNPSRKIRVAIEVDGGYHFTPEQQIYDRKKEADLLKSIRVWCVLRISAKNALSMDREALKRAILSTPMGAVTKMY